ncbi:MAG: tetratricopeptide repeat protein [Gemmatimonadota bacterium]|jgi:tetratricopeptide (TPR) repeat protein
MRRVNVSPKTLVVLAVAAGMAWSASPVRAQQAGQQQSGERYRVLVPPLAPNGNASDKFGKKTADEFKKLIENLPTHQPVDKKDLKDALKRYKLKEDQLTNCVTARQLAAQIKAQLVMCGSYQETAKDVYQVTASFHSSDTEDVFDVPSFTASDPKEAAGKIMDAFQSWVTVLQRTVYCAQYVESHQWKNAIDNCNQALAINPKSQSALYNKAYALMHMDSLEQALTYFKQVLDLNPVAKDALLSAGIVNARLNRRDEAQQYFTRYMQLEPGNVDVRLSVATDIYNQGAPLEALHLAQAGLQLEPNNLQLWTYIGNFAVGAANKLETESRGANGEATADSAQVDSLYETAVNAYGKVHEAKGDTTNPGILQRMVVALTKLHRTDQALSLGQKATTLAPDSADVWDAYSRALEQAGNIDQALQALDKVAALDSTAKVTGRRGNLLLKASRYDQAAKTFEQAVQSGELTNDEAFNAMFATGYKQFQNKNFAEAVKIFDAARPLAVSDRAKNTVNFWTGYVLFQQGQQIQAPSNYASAQKALPVFQRALGLFKQATGYSKYQPSVDVQKFIDNTNQFIDIQQALIKRGKAGGE